MRPLKLTMQAFGSYINKQVLDLDSLGNQGLYLITGKTGGGKTSIFDAILYALYGVASGENRDVSTLRSSSAGFNNPTRVELEFLYHNKVYKIMRMPDQERKKDKGEGTTMTGVKAELICPNAPPITKPTEATAKIEEILGINASQFKQISMLAQGEFKEILTAKSNERQKIFRSLFGTEKYDKLSLRLKAKLKDKVEETKKASTTVQTYIAGIQNKLEKYDTALAEVKQSNNATDTLDLLEKLIDEYKQVYDSSSERITKLNNDMLSLSAQVGKLKQIKKNQEDLDNAKATIGTLTKAKSQADSEFNLAKSNLENQDKLIKQQETLKAKKEILDELEKEQNELEKAKLSLKKLDEKQKEYKSAVDELIDEKQNAMAIVEKHKDISGAEATCKNELELAKKTIAELGEIDENLMTLSDLNKKIETAKKEYENSKKKAEECLRKHSEAKQEFLDNQAGIMASNLKDDEKCPVCGSKQHPNKAKFKASVCTASELEQLDKASVVANNEQTKKSEDLKVMRNNSENMQKNLLASAKKLLKIDSLDKLVSSIKTEKTTAEKNAKTLQEKQLVIAESIKLKAKAVEVISVNSDRLTKSESFLQQVEKDIASDTAKIKAREEAVIKQKAKAGNSSLESITGEIIGIENQIANIKKQYEKADENQKLASDSYTKTMTTIATLEKSIGKDNANNLPMLEAEQQQKEAEYKNLQQDKQEYSNILSANKTAYKNIKVDGSKLAKLQVQEATLKELSQTMAGDLKGKVKLPVEVYAQCSYFKRVISRANIKFLEMSDNQYELSYLEPKEGKSIAGLELELIDHNTQTKRAVNSLSGGESFMASLSLALGLAEEIQANSGGVMLESMYIDEGFGTLDDESLKKSIDALKRVSQSDRLIGIISHVSELKNKIDKQIIVSKTLGSSTATIVEI